MKHLFFFLITAFLISCSNQQSPKEQEAVTGHHHHEGTAQALTLNNGEKWKADASTRKNVDAMMAVLNDPGHVNGKNMQSLKSNLQTSIDTLVKECKMSGPDHDALHLWLEKVLSDLKEIDKGAQSPEASYAMLKMDIGSFYEYFE